MKRIIICMLALVLLTGCGAKDKEEGSESKATVQSVTCAKMKNMLDNEKDIVLIDVSFMEKDFVVGWWILITVGKGLVLL